LICKGIRGGEVDKNVRQETEGENGHRSVTQASETCNKEGRSKKEGRQNKEDCQEDSKDACDESRQEVRQERCQKENQESRHEAAG
jgi:hypothetical protein